MRGARGLIGLPVIELATGKRMGTARDILVDKSWIIRGIVLDYHSWFAAARLVDWNEIRSAGDDAVMIGSKKAVRKYKDKDMPDVYYLCGGKKKLQGLPLVSAEGIQMGHLEDVYFSEKMEDSIVGLELSEGLLTDLQEGRRRIPVPAGAKRGVDVITVPGPPPV